MVHLSKWYKARICVHRNYDDMLPVPTEFVNHRLHIPNFYECISLLVAGICQGKDHLGTCLH